MGSGNGEKSRKIIGLMVCGGGEADRYLEESLKEFKRLCDDAVIALNNPTQKEKDLINKYGFWWYEDNREWGKEQPNIKTDLLKKIALLKPDWIIPLDADEVFDPKFTREEAEKLANTKSWGYHFYVINLWNDPEHYWKTGSFWNVRMFRYKSGDVQYIKKNVHCGLAPPYAYHQNHHAPFHVKHFGLMKQEDRDKKVARYEKYDPKKTKLGIASYYESIRGKGLGTPFDEEDMRRKVAEDVGSMKQNYNKETIKQMEKKFVYVRRLADGAILDIPAKHLHETLKKGFEFVSEVTVGTEEQIQAPIVREGENQVQCPLCGIKAKSEKGLIAHKSKKHK